MEPPIQDLNHDVEFFRQRILCCVELLFKMVQDSCFNALSPNCTYILSEIKDSTDNGGVQAQRRVAENKQKLPVTLPEILPAFAVLYPDMHDVNIYVYKATRTETIIDIRYYRKLSLPAEYREQVKDQDTMWHSKISHPPYSKENKRFDINWEHDDWRMFWWKLSLLF